MRDARATADRILAAAIGEFADRGLAGGRVDRIANAAGSNVRLIYAYFGNKERLFATALAAAIREMAARVPPDPDDLAGWAGRLFDYHRERPAALRLNMWAQLERPDLAAEPLDEYLTKVAAISARPAAGVSSAVDLLVLVYGLSQTWYLTPTGLLQSDGSDPTDDARIAQHRDSVVEAVRRMVR